MEKTGQRPINDQWMAGYVDGEGCFLIKETGGTSVNISNTHLPTLRTIQREYGGTIRPKQSRPNARPSFVWNITGKGSNAVCLRLKDHLVEKREQCEALLAYRALPRGRSPLKRALRKEITKMKRPIFSLEDEDANRPD